MFGDQLSDLFTVMAGGSRGSGSNTRTLRPDFAFAGDVHSHRDGALLAFALTPRCGAPKTRRAQQYSENLELLAPSPLELAGELTMMRTPCRGGFLG